MCKTYALLHACGVGVIPPMILSAFHVQLHVLCAFAFTVLLSVFGVDVLQDGVINLSIL